MMNHRDLEISLTVGKLAETVRRLRFVEAALAQRVDREILDHERFDLKVWFGNCLVAARDLRARHRLATEDLALVKLERVIPVANLAENVGKTLRRATLEHSFRVGA